MKKIFSILSLLLLFGTVAFAGNNKVKIAEMSNGAVSYGVEGSTVTLTVTPADGYYLSEISAVKTISAAALTRSGEIPVGGSYTMTKTSASADRSQVATYTLSLEDDYHVYVTASFAARTAITADQVSLSAASFIYDATAHKPTVAVAGLTENKDYTVSYAETAWTNAGTYTVNVAGIDTYKGSLSKTFAIARKGVTVTADDKTKEFGAADPELTATVAGVIGEDKIAYTLARAEGEDAGEYTITAAGEATQGNYSVTYAGAKFTITAANGAVTAPTAITGLEYNGKAQNLIAAGSSATGTIQYSLDGNTYAESIPQGTDAKEYTVYYKVVADANHKDVAAATLKVTIARKGVTVTAEDKTKEYGAADPELTATVAGVIGEDKIAYTLTRAEGEDAGEYAITAAGEATQGNYSVTFVAGKFTITKPEPNTEVVNPDETVTVGGETFYEPKEETKEALKEHFDTDLALSAEAANSMTVNSNGEMEFKQGKNVDVAIPNKQQGDVMKFEFEGKMYGDSSKLRRKGVASTRSAGDMELISGAEYEVLESGNIVLTVAAQEAPVTFKGISTTAAGATGIEAIDKEQQAADSWYDLNGQRLPSKPTKKGLYIRNGQKVVIK